METDLLTIIDIEDDVVLDGMMNKVANHLQQEKEMGDARQTYCKDCG